MSNYVKTTNFTAKDSLPTGDANKVIRGSEFDTEFNALQVSSATKANLGSPTFTGTATFDNVTVTGTADLSGASVSIDINGGTIDNAIIGGTTPAAGTFTSLVAATADINGGTIDGTVIGGSTPAAGTFAAVVGTTGTFSSAVSGTTGTFTGAVSGTTGTFSGAVTGSNLNIANWDTAYGWGNHATAGYLTSVAFTDIDAGAVTLSSETFADVDNQIPTNAAVIDYVAATIPTIAEVNDLSEVVTWTTVPDAYISASSVNQHVTLEKATQTKTYTNGETSAITLSQAITSGAPVVSVIKEVPQTGVTNNDWDAAAGSYAVENSAYATTLGFVGFNVSAASFVDSFSVSSQDNNPTGLAFSADGTKMYVTGRTNDKVFQYALSTAFDVSTASYTQEFDVSSQAIQPAGLAFNTDGTKMFVTDYDGDDVNEYALSTGFDVSTASFTTSFSVASQEGNPQDIAFNSDGTKMFIVGYTVDAVQEYALSTGFDVSTASHTQSFSVSSQETSPRGLAFNTDGTKMFVVGTQNDAVLEYTLSTGFDISSASFDSSYSVSDQDSAPKSIRFNTDGTKMFILGDTGDDINEYNMTPSSVSLGTGSFASTDVGKTINVNDGALVLTATDGSLSITTALTSYNTAASGSWSMNAVVYDATADVLKVSQFSPLFGITSASYTGNSKSVSAQETNTFGLAFGDSGTKMYIVGFNQKTIFQYTLTTAYDVSTASYASKSLNISARFANPRGIAFTPDGTTVFVNEYDNDDIETFTLSTAWDISSGSATNTSFLYTSQDERPRDMHFSPDGTRLIVSLDSNILQYNLSTGFDITSMSYSGNSITTGESYTAVAASPDGLTLLLGVTNTGKLYQYSLSSAFDISTSTFVQSFDASSLGTSILDAIVFNEDGSKFFIVGDSDTVYEFSTGSLITATGYQPCISSNIDTTYWTDINSLTATNAIGNGNVFYAVSNDDKTAWSVLDNTGGTRKIVKNNGGTYQYNSNGTYGSETWVNATTNTEVAALREAMEGASAVTGKFDVSTVVYSQNLSVASQDTVPEGIAFNTDGTKMFIVGSTGDDVNEYALSTGFDVSTASYSQNFSILAQDTVAQGIAFNTAGTKMFIVGSTGDDVNEYTLTTGFDVSTASYSQNFSVVAQDNRPYGIAFNADGTKMFVVGNTAAKVMEYTLSTGFDVSTASFVDSFSVNSQDSQPQGLAFNTDGTKMFVVGNNTNKIYEYALTTGFDVSSSSFTQSISIPEDNVSGGTEGVLGGLAFNTDGTKMFVVGSTKDAVYEYNVGTTSYTNQMDSTALNAITDANQITLGNDLDFAAILYLSSGSTVPTYSGTAVNYDANVINQGAVLGTDYNWDFPSSTSVRLTSLGDYNLKVRII